MRKRAQAWRRRQTAVLTHLSTDGPLARGRRRIWLLGAGKASTPLAQAVEKACGKRTVSGCVGRREGGSSAAAGKASAPLPQAVETGCGKRIVGGCEGRREGGGSVAVVLRHLSTDEPLRRGRRWRGRLRRSAGRGSRAGEWCCAERRESGRSVAAILEAL